MSESVPTPIETTANPRGYDQTVLPSLAYRGYVLFMLVMVGAVAMIDRTILTILVEPIRREFSLSDSQIGLLTGVAFALVYAVACVPAARLADRTSHKAVIAAAVTLWSFMTVLCGLAQNFVQMFLGRVGVGLGEAGSSAPSQALLSDLFPQRQRSTVMAIYLLGAPIGTGVGLGLGGWALGEYGWRTAMILAGVPGLILGPLVFLTIRNMRKGLADGITQVTAQKPLAETIGILWRIPTLPLMLAATMVNSVAGFGIFTWIPAFLERSHGLTSAQIGGGLGLAMASGSILGHLAGGPLADLLGRRDLRWHLWIPTITSLLVGVIVASVLNAPPALIFPLIGLQVFVSGLFSAPMMAIATTLPPVWARATSAACNLLLINIVGLGFGSWAVGQLSDLLRPAYGEESLRIALLCTLVLVIPTSFLYYLASRHYRADFANARTRLGEEAMPASTGH